MFLRTMTLVHGTHLPNWNSLVTNRANEQIIKEITN